MNRRTPRVLCSLLLGLAFHAAAQETSRSPAATPGFEVERVSWVGSIAQGRLLTVENRFGDLRARFGGYEGRVELLANVQHFADEGARLVVEAKETQAGVEVTVGLRRDDTGELITWRDPDHKKRADMVIYVPEGVPLSALTDHGLIDARGLKSDVRASTVGGEITVRKIDGEMHLETESGAMQVLLEGWHAARRHSFASESGDMTIYFAGEVSALVDVSTSGLISTDYSMEIDYQADRRPVRRGEALVGKGSSAVSISSVNGHVRLVRRPLARKARVRLGTGR